LKKEPLAKAAKNARKKRSLETLSDLCVLARNPITQASHTGAKWIAGQIF
jgi:hypothetical protein